MTVSKETMLKAKRYEKACAEVERLYKELAEEFSEIFAADGCYITGFGVADEPCGDEQGDGEYCSQGCYGECSDSGSGHYYYPVEHSRKYLYVQYEF